MTQPFPFLLLPHAGASRNRLRRGEKGDVLMYVSSQCDPTGENKNLESTLHEAYGDRLTYIPSDRISRINMRFRKVTSRPSTEAASADRSLRAS